MKKSAVVRLCYFAAVLILYSGSMPTAAEDKHPPSDESSMAGKTPATNDNAAILAELERMRARIQELEAQLKAQSATPPAQPATGEQFSASVAAQPALTPSAADRQEQVKTEKTKAAEPFAFADFTWLNGNARTKTPAF